LVYGVRDCDNLIGHLGREFRNSVVAAPMRHLGAGGGRDGGISAALSADPVEQSPDFTRK
jgi:hypothetical protein